MTITDKEMSKKHIKFKKLNEKWKKEQNLNKIEAAKNKVIDNLTCQGWSYIDEDILYLFENKGFLILKKTSLDDNKIWYYIYTSEYLKSQEDLYVCISEYYYIVIIHENGTNLDFSNFNDYMKNKANKQKFEENLQREKASFIRRLFM